MLTVELLNQCSKTYKGEWGFSMEVPQLSTLMWGMTDSCSREINFWYHNTSKLANVLANLFLILNASQVYEVCKTQFAA